MKRTIVFFISVCFLALTSANAYTSIHSDAQGHHHHPSDANIVGHVTDKSTGEHIPYVNIFVKGTTIGTLTDATGHYFLKNLPEGKIQH